MIAEREARWSRAAQVGMLMRAYRETFRLTDGKRGLTQANLLQRMSEVNGQYAERYSHVTVSRWESGSTLPTEQRLRDFGAALDLTPAEVDGLLSLAGFRQGADSGLAYTLDAGTDGDGGVVANPGQQPRPVPVDVPDAHSGSDARSKHPISGSAIPDMGSIIRHQSYKYVLTGVVIAVMGYALAAFGWDNSWMPLVYVAAIMCLAAAQGLLYRRRPHDLGEFYSATVFFLLSTFLLQSAFTRVDPYGFYTMGDYAGTHIPYLLALEVNLALASIAGLAFHMLRQWQYSGNQRRSNGLKRAAAVALPPTLFAYASIVIISNVSLWIQLVMVLPSMAGVFLILLVLRDPTVRPDARDRRFALGTAVAATAVMGTVGAAVVATLYLAPDTPSVLPDHNLWTSWEIDFSRLGYPQGQAMERLNQGYLWHGLATLFYTVGVIGGVLISALYRIGRGDAARVTPETRSSSGPYHAAATRIRRAASRVVPGQRTDEMDTGGLSGGRSGFSGIAAISRLFAGRKQGQGRLATG